MADTVHGGSQTSSNGAARTAPALTPRRQPRSQPTSGRELWGYSQERVTGPEQSAPLGLWASGRRLGQTTFGDSSGCSLSLVPLEAGNHPRQRGCWSPTRVKPLHSGLHICPLSSSSLAARESAFLRAAPAMCRGLGGKNTPGSITGSRPAMKGRNSSAAFLASPERFCGSQNAVGRTSRNLPLPVTGFFRRPTRRDPTIPPAAGSPNPDRGPGAEHAQRPGTSSAAPQTLALRRGQEPGLSLVESRPRAGAIAAIAASSRHRRGPGRRRARENG